MPNAIRWIIRSLCVLMALGLLAAALVFWGFSYLNAAPDPLTQNSRIDGLFNRVTGSNPFHSGGLLRLENDNSLFIEVRTGESASSVGNRLEEAGVIRSRFLWNLLFRFYPTEHVKAGSYLISLPATQMEIRSILIGGEQFLVRVTIPEGATLKRAAAILEEAGVCGTEEFLLAASSAEILGAFNIPGQSMEGYLFPETYLFPLSYPASRVVWAMAETFFQRIEGLAQRPLSPGELNDIVIMASIVEREHRIPEEAAIMAGVFYNRLGIGMALQSCATVEYIITEIQGLPHPEVILYRDLEIQDPYNTYIRTGLPPGPISAPGETAILAALHPASTNYLFFRLIDPQTGRHHFSRTLDEHNRAGIITVTGR